MLCNTTGMTRITCGHSLIPGFTLELKHTNMCAFFCSRSIILHARILTEATAVLVVDKKGRIQHATTKLASLLGYPVHKLCTMELNALLPQPTCQMHGAWFKVGSKVATAALAGNSSWSL